MAIICNCIGGPDCCMMRPIPGPWRPPADYKPDHGISWDFLSKEKKQTASEQWAELKRHA